MILDAEALAFRLFDKKPIDLRIGVVPFMDRSKFAKGKGASIDLSLGRWFRTMRQSNIPVIKMKSNDSERSITKEHFIPFDSSFVLHPGKFVLGMTLEWISIPIDLAGQVTGKSSLGRRGLIIETAAAIHPGYVGCLTLELANVGEIPIELEPGMAICQIILQETTGRGNAAVSQFKGSRKPELGDIG